MDIHFTMKNQANLQQRMTFYCVPIPGESEWVKQVNKLKYYNNNNLYCNLDEFISVVEKAISF